MSRVLITGSADGLGRLAAEQLVTAGHEVVLHARDRRRADDALGACFYHRRPRDANPSASDLRVQDELLGACEQLTGETIIED